MKYFLYIRKSTDEGDRQILSLEAQKTELHEFALRENLIIIDTFSESQTAKEPGRPIFNEMLKRIESGEAEGILAWHPDRLARNSVDGGKIIFLVDSGKIKSLKFPTFWFEATPQGKFMLNIAFGQSKYFVDNLSENTKRGLRQKLRRGEWPGYAPLGYLNELRTHTIIKDPKRYRLIQKLFKLYSTKKYSLKDLRGIGLLSRHNKLLSISNIQNILTNPFYYGTFKYNSELYEGKHEPIISKKLFDLVQEILKEKSRPRKSKERKLFAFRGLLKCEECGCCVTAETQKGHNYYRCTKKRIDCSQPYVREEKLTEQISDILQKVSLSDDWAASMLAELEKEKTQIAQSSAAFAQNLKQQIKEVENKLDKLLDAHLDNTISKQEYAAKKEKLINHKIEITEKLGDFERKGNNWLEPARNFILAAKQAKNIAEGKNLSAKKDFFQKIGSNPLLRNRKVVYFPHEVWKILENEGAERQCREAPSLAYSTMLREQGSNLRHPP